MHPDSLKHLFTIKLQFQFILKTSFMSYLKCKNKFKSKTHWVATDHICFISITAVLGEVGVLLLE